MSPGGCAKSTLGASETFYLLDWMEAPFVVRGASVEQDMSETSAVPGAQQPWQDDDLTGRPEPALDEAQAPAGGRLSVFRRLLDGQRAVRVRALAQARERRWLDADSPLLVALVDSASPDDDPRRLAVALQADGRGATWHIGDAFGLPVIVTSCSRVPEPARQALEREVRRHGHPHARLHDATLQPDEDDLLPAVREAFHARAAMDDGAPLPPGVRLLLEDVEVPIDLLRRASPGAFALWRSDDDAQLATVEAYLDAGGRVSEACRRLHIHRTTLYYRLENLPELVRDELADGLRRSVMHVVLMTLRSRAAGEDAALTGG